MWLYYAYCLALAIAGWYLFKLVKMPAPAIIGPMFFVGAWQISGLPHLPALPNLVSLGVQVAIGLIIGTKVNKSQIEIIRQSLIPCLLIVLWTIVLTFGMAKALSLFFNLEYVTGFFSAAPGGITEMSLMALLFKADVGIVAAFQATRVMAVNMFFPFLAQKYNEPGKTNAGNSPGKNKASRFHITVTVAFGVLGGVLLFYLHVPAGGIFGAIVGSAFIGLFSVQSFEIPRKLNKVAHIGVGILVGLNLSHDAVTMLPKMLAPVLFFTLAVVLLNTLLSILIWKITKWNMATCLLSSAPGGLTSMVALAESMDVNALQVSILQLVRLLTIIVLAPVIIGRLG